MLRKPQMLLIPEPWCNKNSMIINLQRGAVEQEEDARVPAAVPRYTIKLLGKSGKSCNSSVCTCL